MLASEVQPLNAKLCTVAVPFGMLMEESEVQPLKAEVLIAKRFEGRVTLDNEVAAQKRAVGHRIERIG